MVMRIRMPRIGLTLAMVETVSYTDNLRVVTNNSRAVLHLLTDRVTLLCDNVLTLLNIGGVHHSVILSMAGLVILGMASLLYLYVVLGVAMFLLAAISKVSPARSSTSSRDKKY